MDLDFRDLLPQKPREGPPLPRFADIKWPALTFPRVVVALTKSIREEQKAIRNYRQRAGIAREESDTGTAFLFDHIAGEEEIHAREFQKRLKELA